MNKLKAFLVSIIIGLAVAGIVFAWTNPTGNPTYGGGALYYFGGNVGIGTTNPTAKLEVVGTMKVLGNWESRNIGTSYTATTDGFVLAFCYAANSANGETPTGTVRTGAEASGTQADGFTMPVRKGDTWRVSRTSGSGTISVYWIPFGT